MSYARQVIVRASEDRIEKLIAERLKPGADKAAIDARIWDLFGETWAVMFTDLSGFSRGVADFGIVHYLQVIYESERLFVPCIDRHDGILLKTEGDSLLVIFRNPAKAVDCAVEMQRVAAGYNADRDAAEKVLLCVGIGYGPVLRIGDRDVYGSEVNAASKLGEDTAMAGEILVTDSLQLAIASRNGYLFDGIDFVPPGAKGAYRLRYA
jgi:class 3 adenylate cyclase